MPETPAERSEHARRANLARQAQEPSGAAMTAAARAVANDPDRFAREARERHPDASPADVARMAAAARDLWAANFSQVGVRARQVKAMARAAQDQADASARAARRARREADRLADAITG